MGTSNLLEKDIEDILAKHHAHFIEHGLQFQNRQVSVKGGRADLIFNDRFGDELIVEIKRGPVTREAVAQLMDYLGHLASDRTHYRLMLIAGSIAANWKNAMDRQGIEYREYTEKDYIAYLEAHDQDLLKSRQPPKETPITVTTPESPPQKTRDLCGSFEDFLILRNFNAGEGITEKSTEQWLQDRRRAKEKYRTMFNPSNLEKMSNDDFEAFLYFKNNRSWTQLYRRGLRLTKDMQSLRKTIAYIQDETMPIEYRLRDVFRGGSHWIKGLGPNIVTGILHFCDQGDIYGVWNNRTIDTLTKLGYLNRRINNRGKDYLVINSCLYQLRSDIQKCKPDMIIDLDVVDSFVWFISKDKLDYVEKQETEIMEAAKLTQRPDIVRPITPQTVTVENFFGLITGFERETRSFIKKTLGASYDDVIRLKNPELIEKWSNTKNRAIRNGANPDSDLINYAETGDYIKILFGNKDKFAREGYQLQDVITHFKIVSDNRGMILHSGDNEINLQQYYVTKGSIEWIQTWMRN